MKKELANRCAQAVASIRKDWDTNSLTAMVANTFADNEYERAVIALTLAAIDPKIKSPGIIKKVGPDKFISERIGKDESISSSHIRRCKECGKRIYSQIEDCRRCNRPSEQQDAGPRPTWRERVAAERAKMAPSTGGHVAA